MDIHLGQELLDELGSTLESLETQHGALLQFLKDKGLVTDEQLAPYLTQAGNASNVRWRAARLRLLRILSGALEKEEEDKKRQESPAATQSAPEKESAEAGTAVKVDTQTGEQKKTEEKTEKAEAKSTDKKAESVGSSDAKAGEETEPSTKKETTPSAKEDATPSAIEDAKPSEKEAAEPSKDRKEEAA